MTVTQDIESTAPSPSAEHRGGAHHPVARLAQVIWDVVASIWPAYVLASVSILIGFEWGLPDGGVVPRGWLDDEGGAVWAIQQISFPLFYPPWLAWGTALFYQVYAVTKIASLGGLVEFGDDREVLVLGRLVVYASALGAITAVFLLGRRLFDAWTGKVAAVLLAVSPGFVVTAHYFKVEVPMTFWLVVTLLAVFRMRDTAAIRDVAIVGLLVGYTASTQYSGGLVAVAAVTALFQAKLPDVRRAAKVLAGTVVVGFLMGTPYALLYPPAFYDGLRLDFVLNSEGTYTLGRPPAVIDWAVNVFPYAVTIPILVLAGIGLVTALVRERRRLLPIWVFLGAYVVLLGFSNARFVRATVPVLPVVVLLAAYGLSMLRRRRWMRVPALVGVTVLAGYAFLFSLAYVKGAYAEDDPRVQASRWIRDEIPVGTRIAVNTNHYLDVPQLEDLGYPTIEVGDDARRLRTAASAYLILSERQLRPRRQALEHHPETAALLDYVSSDFCELVHFENSQRLAGVDAKPRDGKLPFDWLIANPRITILERRQGGEPCTPFDP